MAIFDVAGVPSGPSVTSQASASDFTLGGTSGAGTAAMLLPALTSILGAGGAVKDIQRKSEATIANIKAAGRSLKFSQHGKAEQLRELDRVMGDKLSMSGLESMKREARLKAASAETGTSGASVESAIAEAYTEENFRGAAILRDADIQRNDLRQSMVADLLQFQSQAGAQIASMRSPLSAGMEVAGATISGFNQGLSFLTQADKDRILGVDQGRTI